MWRVAVATFRICVACCRQFSTGKSSLFVDSSFFCCYINLLFFCCTWFSLLIYVLGAPVWVSSLRLASSCVIVALPFWGTAVMTLCLYVVFYVVESDRFPYLSRQVFACFLLAYEQILYTSVLTYEWSRFFVCFCNSFQDNLLQSYTDE